MQKTEDFLLINADQINQMREALKGYDEENIEAFIEEIDLLCWFAVDRLNLPSPYQQMEDLHLIEKSFEDSIKNILLLGKYHKKVIQPLWVKDFDEMDQLRETNYDRKRVLGHLKLCGIALKSLQGLSQIVSLAIKNLEKQKRKRKPPADKLKFVKQIAKIYSELIDKPTTYKFGPFAEVVKIVLEILGLDRSTLRARMRKLNIKT